MTKLVRRRLRQWLCAAALALAVPAGFVAVVDPFGYFGVNTVGYYYSSERQFKQALLRAANYNAIVVVTAASPTPIRHWSTCRSTGLSTAALPAPRFSEQVDLLFDASSTSSTES